MAFQIGSLIPWVQMQFCDDDGAPLAGGSVTFKVTGTATNKDTFSNSDLDPAHVNDNPVLLDANGRPDSDAIFLEPGGYDITVKDSLGATVYTVEGVEDVGLTFLDELGQTLGDGEGDAPDGYTITEDDNTITALPVAGGDYYLPAALDRGLPVTFINKGNGVTAFLHLDGSDTVNGVSPAMGLIEIPAGTSPIFSGISLYPHAPSDWRMFAYWTS